MIDFLKNIVVNMDGITSSRAFAGANRSIGRIRRSSSRMHTNTND